MAKQQIYQTVIYKALKMVNNIHHYEDQEHFQCHQEMAFAL